MVACTEPSTAVTELTLATASATAGQRRAAAILCVLFSAVTAALLPFATHVHAPVPAFVPIYQTTVIIAYALTTYLLFSHFRRTRVLSLLWVGAGALYTAVILFLQLLSFPNMLAPGRLLGSGPETTSWLWTFWHIGPPVFALGYAIAERRGAGRQCDTNQVKLLIWSVVATVLALIATTSGVVTQLVASLPAIVNGDDYWQLTTSGVGPAVEGLTVLALGVLWWTTRGRTVLHLWLMVSLFTLILDNGLTLLGAARGSVGWTFGRLEALLSASFLLMVYLREIGVLYGRIAEAAHRLTRSNEVLEDRVRERTEALTQALAETQRARDTLEERVAERTRDLEVATDEKLQAQAALQQAQKMEAIGQLTGGIAHDFNNLLTAVIGNIDLARSRSEDAKIVRLLENAIKAAGRGAALTEQLLAFSRKQHLALKPVDINHLVAGMDDLLLRALGGTVRIERLPAPDLWPAVADPNQVELAVLNLAINARDAVALGGSVTIETANLPQGHPDIPDDVPAGDYVLLSVADTGTGMPADVLARAFEPFFTTKEVGHGSGLGLSMVEGVVKQSGGTVTISSAIGSGTTVRLFLRRADAPAVVAEAPATRAITQLGSGSTVLLVDDDSDVRAFTATCLMDLGYQVAQAASGRIALGMLECGQEADLLVLDFAMPGMNGAEVATRARHLRPHLPILFITGYTESEAFFDAVGADQILKKPFLPADIAGKVHAMLGPARARPSNVLAWPRVVSA
ncbi:MASE4 domain-containing protein [Azospirillum sp. sgz301742]